MQFDNGWRSLLRPGSATDYFQPPDWPAFVPDAPGYSAANACWLAECARLIYRGEAGEGEEQAQLPGRDAILRRAGLREARFFDRNGTQGALFESLPESPARFAVLVFRGTRDLRDWLTNVQALPVPWPGGGSVHAGFKAALDAVWAEVEEYLEGLASPVFYTGHSLGAALATLAAARRPPRALYTFGSPRVGDRGFADCLTGLPAYRIVNHCDIVPTLPPGGGPLAFCHVGQLHYINHDHRLLVEPREFTLLVDWLKNSPELADSTDYRRWFDPVEFLADHAPVNYVAHLLRQAGGV